MTVRGTFEFLRHWRVLIQVGFMLAVTLGYVWLDGKGFVPLNIIENRVVDWRMTLRGPRQAPDEMVILGVGESAFTDVPWKQEDLARTPELAYVVNKWPWNRIVWGKLTDRLLKAGAKEVVFDITFLNPGEGDLECGEVFERQASRLAVTGILEEKEVYNANSLSEKSVKISEPTDDLLPEKGPEIVGMANVITDEDGLIRRLYHAYNIELEKNPQRARDKEFMVNRKPDAVSVSWLAAEKALGHVPAVDPWEATDINYYGPPDQGLSITPIEDVFLNWDTSFHHGDFFKDKYVFIGCTAYSRFKDSLQTPMGLLPGVEIHATAFENLIRGEWLRPAARWVTPALAILFGLLALLVSLRIHSVLGKIGLLLGSGVVFAVVTQWLFSHQMLMVPVTGTFLGLVGCGGFGTVYDFVLERYERRRMLGVFETMVSPGVASLVLSNREDFESSLGGQRREVVILFSDIRGFTTWSEKVGPEALVTQLNEYFQSMVEVIQQEGGTVQKYIGDALMAAWGDVYERPLKECALQAVRAALRMEEELKKLNTGWVGQAKREQLGFGIGINLGEGVIGRIGHTRRQEFTVMGDAVNLAARLESATKQYHLTILVGQQIYDHAQGEFDFRLADKMQVKGKTFAVPVYTPMGKKTGTPPAGLAEYNAAIEKYYARDFAGAAALFTAANEKMGGGDFLCENYLERSRDFMAEPPPADWDGAWVLKDK